MVPRLQEVLGRLPSQKAMTKELFRSAKSLDRDDRIGAEREPRNRLLQHYSGPDPGGPGRGLGVFFGLEILALSAGRRRLSSPASC